MKRGKPLARRTGLRTNTPLRATKPLQAKRIGLARKPKKTYRPPPRTADEQAAVDAVKARSVDGGCELRIAGVCQGNGREFQHRLAKGHGGQWTAGNGLWVCGHGNRDGCHGYLHQHPTEAYRRGWSVKSGQDPLRAPVELHHGLVLLDDAGSFTPALELENT